MKGFLGLAVGVFLLMGFGSSTEAITIDIAEVQNGVAFLRGGGVAANATISWQGANVAVANTSGSFNFTGAVPDSCIGTLGDGKSTIQVAVLDCTPGGSNKIVNGRFENGDLTGWETIGDVSIQTASFGVRPSQGTFQVLITNAPDPLQEMIPSFSGTDAVSNGLGTLFDATTNYWPILFIDLAQAGPFAQSGIKQTFTAKKSGVLTFDWNFLTNEGGTGIDGAVFVLDDTVLSLNRDFQFLPWIGGEFAPLISSPTVFNLETGYQRAEVPIEAGTHTFGFGIASHLDTRFVSALLIDNVKFSTGGAGTN